MVINFSSCLSYNEQNFSERQKGLKNCGPANVVT